MEISKDKLLAFWKIRKQIFSDERNARIVKRYEAIKMLFQDILNTRVSIAEQAVVVNGQQVLLDGKDPSLNYFGCMQDEVTANVAFQGILNMADKMPEFRSLIMRIGCLLGGFDFDDETHPMYDEFRIISNTITNPSDNGSLNSNGQMRHPSSHFADNNYFFRVIEVIQQIKEGTFNPDTSNLVLRWPNETIYKDYNIDSEEGQHAIMEMQRETLKGRFPYKFFYMWTHDCLHPVSLLAYRNLVQQTDEIFQYKDDLWMDNQYVDFISGWDSYCDAFQKLIQERTDNFWDEMSKLISILMIRDQDATNMKELLDTGNKAIVLYGPPGTGKTYHAKELVCQELEIDESERDSYKFSEATLNAKGAWDIVQFHPNYTYEDFIGGISPKLSGETLSYTLKEGIFKKMCDMANKHQDKKFILIIDEINRADLSSVFGELMYSLEYRGEAIAIPNFNTPFVIPNNMYLIGTMNSIDKSLVTFDLALRRRFGFFRIMPQLSVLEKILAEYNIEDNNLLEFINRCKEINKKIASNQDELRLGEEYQIGHAYFAKIKDFLPTNGTEEKPIVINSFNMEKLWIYHIEPLLNEYLGNRIEDEEIMQCLCEMKNNFIKNF